MVIKTTPGFFGFSSKHGNKTREMKDKKAQMKIQQMAFMIVAVVVLLVMVGMFVLNIRHANLKQTASELNKQNAVLLASKIANSPEFSCGTAYGIQRSNCVDFDKVMIVKNNLWKYEDFWGISNLEIMIIHDDFRGRDGITPCTMENYPNCNNIVLIDKPISGNDISSFVTICRKENLGHSEPEELCRLGKIFVRYEKYGNEE